MRSSRQLGVQSSSCLSYSPYCSSRGYVKLSLSAGLFMYLAKSVSLAFMTSSSQLVHDYGQGSLFLWLLRYESVPEGHSAVFHAA